jgi:hypothetical protein
MRYKELITEETIEVHSDDINSMYAAAHTILDQCKPFLNQVDEPLSLYRGMGNTAYNFVHKLIRTDGRRPKVMKPKLHDAINKYFTEQFGEPFRDSLMCLGNPVRPQMFGKVHYVFPVGNFRFLWSPEIVDLNYSISRLHKLRLLPSTGNEPDRDIANRNNQIRQDHEQGVGMAQALSEAKYQNTDLQAAINSGSNSDKSGYSNASDTGDHEIMIRGASFYAVSVDYAQSTGFDKILNKVLQ